MIVYPALLFCRLKIPCLFLLPDPQNDRAAYFDQVHNGVYIRMAIILALLGIPDPLTGKKVLESI